MPRRGRRFVANVFRRRRAEDELDAELRAVVAEQIDRKMAMGMSADEARRQALIEAGGYKANVVRRARSS